LGTAVASIFFKTHRHSFRLTVHLLRPFSTFPHSVVAVAKDVPHEADAGRQAEAKQADPPLDPSADRQHDPLQRQAETLAPDQVGHLTM
jgi:hypothetical protein